MLKFIRSSSPLPWVCIGDFNEVLHRSEYVGVQERSAAHIAAFQEMVNVCGLTDICFSGRCWTFEKKASGGSYCRVPLDRALVSGDWYLRFPGTVVQHLVAAASDHGPILLTWCRADNAQKKRHCFTYEVTWEAHEAFTSSLAESWQQDRAAVR
jgi:endonuclease/exonuclease/phosphatase family metal-dependent hydrolase